MEENNRDGGTERHKRKLNVHFDRSIEPRQRVFSITGNISGREKRDRVRDLDPCIKKK